MNRRLLQLLLAGAACAYLVGGARVATAGNHLACYKVKDTITRQKLGPVTLSSNDGGPNQTNCTILTGSKLCCDPVDKAGLPPGGGPTTATTKFCCYKIKCARGPSGTLGFHDQFGNRTLGVTTPTMLCAPASPSGAFLDASSGF